MFLKIIEKGKQVRQVGLVIGLWSHLCATTINELKLQWEWHVLYHAVPAQRISPRQGKIINKAAYLFGFLKFWVLEIRFSCITLEKISQMAHNSLWEWNIGPYEENTTVGKTY